MKILVTGAGGFVGPYLIEHLLGSGHEITAIAHADFDPIAGIQQQVCDVRQAEGLAKLIAKSQPEGVIHLAAQASVAASWEDPAATYETNVIGTSNLLGALEDFPTCRVLLVGSAQQYGRVRSDTPIPESAPMMPSSPYAVSKAAQEMIGRLYFQELGREIIMARSFNHTGPAQKKEYAVASFCSQIAEIETGRAERLIQVGTLSFVRDFLDVRDVVSAYGLLLESGRAGDTYNVCSGTGWAIGDLLKMLLEISHVGDVEIRESPVRAGDPPVLIGDNSKIRSEVGWSPALPMKQSLEETLEWYRRKAERRS